MVGGDITMTSMEKLLNSLKNAKLKPLKSGDVEQYLYDIDDKSIWKNKKRYAVINCFYLVKYELWKERLIKRVFFVDQKWNRKIKEYCNIYEVQRYLAGSNRKWNRWIYQGAQGGVKTQYWERYENSEWEIGNVETVICENQNNYYSTSITVYHYNEFDYFLKQSIHKYCAFDKSGLDEQKLFWFLYQYEKHPQMEMIAKMGLMDIVLGNLSCLRWSQKGYKLLGLDSKEELDQVRICRHFGGLKFYRKHREDIKKYVLDSEHRISIYVIFNDRNYSEISKKLIDYIENQDNVNKYVYHTYAGEYIDYIDMCNQLGMPITSKIKYPDVLREAHDEVNEKIIVFKNEAQDKRILDYVINSLFKYRYADDDFVITPANSTLDLINESKDLKHCVRSYAARYSKGETTIFLIRKREDVLTPYYTLELKNSKINQVRGSHNCDPDQKVKDFVTKWAKRFRFDTNIYQRY